MKRNIIREIFNAELTSKLTLSNKRSSRKGNLFWKFLFTIVKNT